MNLFFHHLHEAALTPGGISRIIASDQLLFNDLYTSEFTDAMDQRDTIEKFVLDRHAQIEMLDFGNQQHTAFLVMLADMCVRLGLVGAANYLDDIIRKKAIEPSPRIKAALHTVCPKPRNNQEAVDRCEVICTMLSQSIEEGESVRMAAMTFISYYVRTMLDVTLHYATLLRDTATQLAASGRYAFMQLPEVISVLEAEPGDTEAIAEKAIRDIIAGQIYADIPEKAFIIEQDTDYSRSLSRVKPSFSRIRALSLELSPRNNNAADCDRGTAIIIDPADMYGYMIRFGNMHEAKLLDAFGSIDDRIRGKRFHIIDWGCGQGFGSMVFLETFGKDTAAGITLIEPSEIALRRAALHVRKFAPDVELRTVCKKFDSLVGADITIPPGLPVIHIFSNTLDLPFYRQSSLTQLISNNTHGEYICICVSPYIMDKVQQLKSFRDYFVEHHGAGTFVEAYSSKTSPYWKCNNGYKGQMCPDHAGDGCGRRWTRATIIFGGVL